MTIIKVEGGYANWFDAVAGEPGSGSVYFDFDIASIQNTVIGDAFLTCTFRRWFAGPF